MSKEQVLAKGWRWEDLVPGTFGKTTLEPKNIPDQIGDVADSILKEALECVQCQKNYNVVPPELQLYRRLNVPVPRLCPDCRYRNRIALRPPRKLWHRQCQCAGNARIDAEQTQIDAERSDPTAPPLRKGVRRGAPKHGGTLPRLASRRSDSGRRSGPRPEASGVPERV
ncbi:MAG: hypothetical protein HY978_04100 [Candidatus Liptonbacteria bacterium]|nr:hypothetical protein [Candidatus Liptonbacteria bacterium]